MAASFLAATLGLALSSSAPRAALHTARPARAARALLCAVDESEERVKAAAARVVAAASQFGDSQSAAAAEWVEEACRTLDAKNLLDEPGTLMEKQMALFDECLIEDAGKCEELDAALTALEAQLKAEVGPIDAFVGLFGQSKLVRACARVRTTAAKFGAAQEKATEGWLAELRGSGGAMNPLTLLEQQESLFGECLIDYEGSGPEKCKELDDALGALQLSLGVRGAVVSTANVGASK